MKIKFIISLIISFLCFNFNYVIAEEQVHEKDKEAYHLFFIHKKNLDTLIHKAKNLKLTEENFLLLCELFKIQHPKFVLKQAIIESGGFKSNVFNKTNNMFGMKVPLRRRTYALKGKKYTNNYAYYESWIHSLADYKLWQGNKTIDGDYTEYLEKRNFAQCKDYKAKLKQ